MNVVVHVSGAGHGHRVEYRKVLAKILADRGVCLVEKAEASSHEDNVMLYSTLDDSTLSFLARAVGRSFVGKTTIGLFLRPGECFRPRIKYRVKFLFFWLVHLFPKVKILSILPYSVDVRFRSVTTGWIFDPQLWDLSLFEVPASIPVPESVSRITEVAQGRKIMLAIGAQNQTKGFEHLCRLWCSSPELRSEYVFVVAGKFAADMAGDIEQFVDHGGLLFDRYIPHSELTQLYDLADAVWTCYPPFYNQASGVFGRAVQFGLPVVVREGSYLDKLAEEIGYGALAIPFDRYDVATHILLNWQPHRRNTEDLVQRLRTVSVDTLVEALVGCDAEENVGVGRM